VRQSRSDDAEVTRWALAASRGSRPDTERFIRATQRDVWRFVAHLANPGTADDLTQETYLRALRSLPRFEARSSARTWLLAIARRVVVDQVRAARARPRTAEVEDWRQVAERVRPTEPTGFDEGVALGELVASLDPQRREAFVLTQTLGLSYAETGVICGCPVGTIRSRVFRARQDLVDLLRTAEHGARTGPREAISGT
jgi:RNA polymerase sigma-70 factor (ECF subfamily)